MNNMGFYTIKIYKNSARAAGDQIAHTASVNSTGSKTLTADNSSGVGGYITIQTLAADNDIIVTFGYCYAKWRPKYYSISEVQP